MPIKVGLMTSRYLHNSQNGFIEVVATGRYVERPGQLNANVKVRYIEVTPIDTDLLWTKFVAETELSIIKEGFID